MEVLSVIAVAASTLVAVSAVGVGDVVAGVEAPDQEACRQLCSSDDYADTCVFFNYFPDDTFCMLVSDETCYLDMECNGSGIGSCVHGSINCELK